MNMIYNSQMHFLNTLMMTSVDAETCWSENKRVT
jgi:hypothetical protein